MLNSYFRLMFRKLRFGMIANRNDGGGGNAT
jgi:hypothetical protein